VTVSVCDCKVSGHATREERVAISGRKSSYIVHELAIEGFAIVVSVPSLVCLKRREALWDVVTMELKKIAVDCY